MYLPKSPKELEIIKTIMEYPNRQWSLKKISTQSKISKTTVWRAVKRLENKGFLKLSKIGNAYGVKVKNESILKRVLKLSSSDIEEMETVAKRYVDEIKNIGEVKKCILFGSVARGTANLKSDIDILILVSEKSEKLEGEINAITEKISSKSSIRIMPDLMKESRFEMMEKHGDSFANVIKKEGIVLYGGKTK